MATQLTHARLQELLGAHEPPCISLYLPTHRRHQDNRMDPVAFKNLVRTVAGTLEQKYQDRAARPLLEPLDRLADESLFWQRTLDGLAVLSGPSRFDVFPLQRPVKPLAVVADSYHVKPLLRYLQSADRFQVLCLTAKTARVLEGTRYALDVAPPEEFAAPLLAEAARQRDLVDNPSSEQLAETERFFRAVDRHVLERFSREARLPLVLAALPEHQTLFRKVSHNPFLLPEGVLGNPEPLALDDLRQKVWQVVEPSYLARLARMKDDFHTAAARHAGTADLSDAARAVVAGRIGTLLIEDDRILPGRLDPATGAITAGDINHPEVDDLLDDLAEMVLRQGGQVVVVPTERMPTTTGLAAIYRY